MRLINQSRRTIVRGAIGRFFIDPCVAFHVLSESCFASRLLLMSIKLWVKSQEGASYLCNLQPFSETYNCNTATKLWNCSRLQVTFYAFCGYSICNFFLLKHIEVVKCLPILIWLYVEWLTLPLADKFQTAASSGWTVKYFVNGFYFSLSVRLYLLLSGCH